MCVTCYIYYRLKRETVLKVLVSWGMTPCRMVKQFPTFQWTFVPPTSSTALGPTQLPSHWTLRDLSADWSWPLTLCSDKAKNEWSYKSTPPTCLHSGIWMYRVFSIWCWVSLSQTLHLLRQACPSLQERSHCYSLKITYLGLHQTRSIVFVYLCRGYADGNKVSFLQVHGPG
jgi:hypothetical protein